jgi:membrane metallo-endopeptidase-like protein 1
MISLLKKNINTLAITFGADAIEKLGIGPLTNILNSYGQWPLTVSNWTEDRFDWRKATASIRNTFGLGFLFEVSNFVDVNNTEFSTLYAS